MRILIVEDEFLLATLLTDELTDAGHTVLGPAGTVTEGLRIIEEHRPDLALVNINLRDGSKGTDLANALMKRWQVPCLFVSGERVEARQHREVALGYISKPYNVKTVLASVEVARDIMEGREPARCPSGLELFGKEDCPAERQAG